MKKILIWFLKQFSPRSFSFQFSKSIIWTKGQETNCEFWLEFKLKCLAGVNNISFVREVAPLYVKFMIFSHYWIKWWVCENFPFAHTLLSHNDSTFSCSCCIMGMEHVNKWNSYFLHKLILPLDATCQIFKCMQRHSTW